MSDEEIFQEVLGSEAKEYGPWFKCKAHGGYFTEADKKAHVRAYHARRKKGASP